MNARFHALAVAMLAASLGFIVPAYGQQDQAAPQGQAGQNQSNPTTRSPSQHNTRPYVGVEIVSLPPELASHLPSAVSGGRGILVTNVAAGSPAEQAGLRPHDILVSYNNQPLYAPEQFMKMVHHDKSGQEISLGIVRGGQEQQVKVKLGEHQMADGRNMHRPFRLPLAGRGQPQRQQALRQRTGDNRAAKWLDFDALTLTRVDKDHFKAEVKYENDQGKVETRTFQGTRDELRKAINAQQDMPSVERDHLLQALNLSNESFGIEFPGIFFDPNGAQLGANPSQEYF